MSQIGDKIREIERNIQEGDMMLRVLRRLPESEETNAQVRRFEELVRKLEEYRNRYQNLESNSGENLEVQLQALRDKQDRIQVLLEETAAGASDSVNCSVAVHNDAAATVVEFESAKSDSCHVSGPSPRQKTRDRRDSDADTDEAEAGKERPGGSSPNPPQKEDDGDKNPSSDVIEPSDWVIHFQAQVCQLSHMLSQIERYEEMVNRLLELVNGLNLTQAAALLSDVLQRFIELQASLISLQKAYDGLKAHDNVSDGFKAHQLTSLRDFLISLGRNLETTKNCFFSVANIVKQSIRDHEETNEQVGEDDEEDDRSEVVTPANVEPTAGDEVAPVPIEHAPTACQLKANGETVTVDDDLEEHDEHSPSQYLENTLSDLCRQRDALLHKLAEARSNTATSISANEDKFNGLTDFVNSKRELPKSQSSKPQFPPMLEKAQVTLMESLPILKKLQARKDHLEELRGELKAFCLQANIVDSPDKEVNEKDVKEDTGNSITPTPGRQQSLSASVSSNRHAPPRPPVGPPRTLMLYKDDNEREGRNVCVTECKISSQLAKLSASELMNVVGSGGGASSSSRSADGHCVSQKAEAVTFQEPEATFLDDQERLYQSIREAHIWQEEQRKREAATISSSSVNGRGNSHRVVNGHGPLRAPSDSTSHDQTAMATWGGSIEGEDADVDDDVNEENVEYLEEEEEDNDDHGGGAMPSSFPRDNSDKHLSIPSFIRTDVVNGKPKGETSTRLTARLSTLPRLGHSPSPIRYTQSHDGQERHNEDEEGDITAGVSTTLKIDSVGRHLRQPHRTIQPNRANLTVFAEDESRCSGAHVAADHLPSIISQINGLEAKIEHLSQVCQLLVSENTRLSTTIAFLLSNQTAVNQQQHYISQHATSAHLGWSSPKSSSSHVVQQPQLQASFMSPQIYSHFSPPGSMAPTLAPGLQLPNLLRYSSYGASLPNSSMCMMPQQPPRPSSPALEKALDQVHSLTSQMMEQQSRVNQLQTNITMMLNQQRAPESAGDQLQHLGSDSGGDQHTFHHQSPVSRNQQHNPPQLISPNLNQMIAAAAATAAAQAQHLFAPQAWTSAVPDNKSMSPFLIQPPPFSRSNNQDHLQ